MITRTLRSPLSPIMLAVLLLVTATSGSRSHAADLDRTDVLQGEAVAVRECGRCHRLEPVSLGVAGSTVFADQVRRADWDTLPLRSWLDIRHRPRVPVVHLSEADIDLLDGYLAWLRQSAPSPLLFEELAEPGETIHRKPQVTLPGELLQVPAGAKIKPALPLNRP